MRKAGIGALVAISLWIHGEASADSLGVVVFPSKEEPALATDVRAEAAALLASEGTEIVDAFGEARNAIRAGRGDPSQTDILVRCERERKEAWRNYLEGRTSFAAERLSELRDESIALAGSTEGRATIAEISLRLGVARLDLNLLAEASDDFRLAHALAPLRTVDDNEFKPEVVESYQRAISATIASQSRPIVVTPSDAGLAIDGNAVSSGDALLSDGLHVLSVRAPGYREYTRILSVAVGSNSEIVVDLKPNPETMPVLQGSLALGTSQSVADRYLKGVVRYSGARGVLLLSSTWRQGQPAVLGQLCDGKEARCSPVIEIGYPEGGLHKAMDALWGRLQASSRREAPSLQSDTRVLSGEGRPVVLPSPPTPLWRNKWVWLGVAGVSALATTAYLLRGDDTTRPVFGGMTCDFGGC